MTTKEELEKQLALQKTICDLLERALCAEDYVKHAEAAAQQVTNEQRHAEAATTHAKRELSTLEAKLNEMRREIEVAAEQKSNLIDEGTVRAQQSLATAKQELDRVRIAAMAEKKRLAAEVSDLTARSEQLKKAIGLLESNKRDLEGGAKQIEDNAIRMNEQINQNKQALEREVGNLQAQKLTLNSDVKRLEAKMDEAKHIEAERKQAAEAAHRVKAELSAIQAQLDAKRLELTDLSRAFNAIKEERDTIEREAKSWTAKVSQLKGQAKRLEREARA